MPASFARLSTSSRAGLTAALLALAVTCGVVLLAVLPQVAQPCVLYGAAVPPADPLRFMLPPLYATPDSLTTTWQCLGDSNRWRELATTLIDNLFALAYGGGLALLLPSLARRAAPVSIAAATLLRCGAICFPIAAAFDLVENQITAALLFATPGTIGDTLITIARYCAVPKYVLSLVIGLALALLGGAIAAVAHQRRQRPNGNGRA